MLKRLFIKDYKNVENSEVRNQYGVVAGVFGIFSNGVLFVIKLIIGIIANSVTIIADAFNNLSDSASSVLTIIGFRLSNKPADREHPYGHARYEYIAGIVISLLILSMGVIFAKTSVEKIFTPEKLIINLATYIVLILAIIVKIIQMLVYLDFANSINSATIKANAIDSRNDVVATFAVFISVVIMGVFNINIDAYMGLIVSIFIIMSGINTLRDTINPLLGIGATPEQIDLVKKKILKHKEIKGIHDLVIHSYGGNNTFVTVHAEVPLEMNIVVAHDIINNIEKEFKEDLGMDLTIHVDPLDLNNEETTRLYKKVKAIFKEFDDTLKMHDFRIISQDNHIDIVFDVLVPYEKNYTKKELIKLLLNNFKGEKGKYYFNITIDRPFS